MPSDTIPPQPPASAATLLWEEGRLAEAIAAAEAALRAKPLDEGMRRFLAELLCFAGELDRAERQVGILLAGSPAAPLGYALLRNLVAGERRRRAVEAGQEVPHLAAGSEGTSARALRALSLLREGAAAEAAALLRADAAAPCPGSSDGTPFGSFRDQDDVFARVFEMLTIDGGLVWLDMAMAERVVLPPPERSRDLLWRPVEFALRDGAVLQGFMPALYPGSHAAADPLRLGHATEWREEGPVVRGIGLRCFEVDAQLRTVLEPGQLRFGP